MGAATQAASANRTIGTILDGAVVEAIVLCTFFGGRFVLLEVAMQVALHTGYIRKPVVLCRLDMLSAVDDPVE